MSDISHHGIKGMKWGKHKQKQLDSLTRISEGKGKFLETLRFKGNLSLVELAANKGDFKKAAAGQAYILAAEKHRYETGTTTKFDKFNRAMNTSIIDLVRG